MAQAGARAGLGLGAVTCLVAAALGVLAIRRLGSGPVRAMFAAGSR
jgi:hypothetical protein